MSIWRAWLERKMRLKKQMLQRQDLPLLPLLACPQQSRPPKRARNQGPKRLPATEQRHLLLLVQILEYRDMHSLPHFNHLEQLLRDQIHLLSFLQRNFQKQEAGLQSEVGDWPTLDNATTVSVRQHTIDDVPIGKPMVLNVGMRFVASV